MIVAEDVVSVTVTVGSSALVSKGKKQGSFEAYQDHVSQPEHFDEH